MGGGTWHGLEGWGGGRLFGWAGQDRSGRRLCREESMERCFISCSTHLALSGYLNQSECNENKAFSSAVAEHSVTCGGDYRSGGAGADFPVAAETPVSQCCCLGGGFHIAR